MWIHEKWKQKRNSENTIIIDYIQGLVFLTQK